MKRRILLFSALILVLSAAGLFAQTGTIRGKVTDKKSGDALAGARVTAVEQDASLEDLLGGGGKQLGRVAGKDGSFELTGLKPGKYIVNASYVGYKIASMTVTVDGGGTATANLFMVADVKGLDEVVVTGVASRTSKAVSEVAVGRVAASEFSEKVGYTTPAQLLSGKVAGVTITQASGQVGGGLRFNIRSGAGLLGGNPVIFVDGVRITSGNQGGIGTGGQQVSPLADLNPADIEDVQILKGAAASALYGTSGQNGVVLIKTKRGKGVDTDVKISYQGIFGVNEAHKKFKAEDLEGWEQANRRLSIF